MIDIINYMSFFFNI